MQHNRRLARDATWIRAQLPNADDRDLDELSSTLASAAHTGRLLDRCRRRLELCRIHRLPGAARVLRAGMERHLHYFDRDVQQCRQLAVPNVISRPSLRDVFEELTQLIDEFDHVKIDRSNHKLSAWTKPIELDGFSLGSFEMQLDLDKLDHENPFRIIACEPNPAESNSEVTHPHVSEERACLGDAAEPLRTALQSGRLCDAFMIVRCVLKTYNPASAFVSLDNWSGTPCHECGVSVEESCSCQQCDHEFCEDCAGYCRGCEETVCFGCLTTCPGCGNSYCECCLTACEHCDNDHCEKCLEDGACSACQESKEPENDQTQTAAGVPPIVSEPVPV